MFPTIPGTILMSIARRGSTGRTTLSLTVRTARKVAAASPPTSRSTAGPVPGMSDDSDGGFTLLEMVCVIALIAMLAAVLLPYVPRQTSRARLQAYALQAATLLQADRNAAIRRRGDVATLVDARSRAIRSGTTAQTLRIPEDVRFDAVLPQTCHHRAAFST